MKEFWNDLYEAMGGNHLTLRLLLDEVILYTVHVLLGLDLAVSEGVADGEAHIGDGHLDVGV